MNERDYYASLRGFSNQMLVDPDDLRNALSASSLLRQKREAAIAWLGDRYLLAHPINQKKSYGTK